MYTKVGRGSRSHFTLSEAGKSQVPTCGKENTNKHRNQDGRVEDPAPLSHCGLFVRTIYYEAVMVANERCNTKGEKKNVTGAAAGLCFQL